jgi:hypothetical protein
MAKKTNRQPKPADDPNFVKRADDPDRVKQADDPSRPKPAEDSNFVKPADDPNAVKLAHDPNSVSLQMKSLENEPYSITYVKRPAEHCLPRVYLGAKEL